MLRRRSAQVTQTLRLRSGQVRRIPTDQKSARGGTFPRDFIWGVAASAPQIEGAAYEDGKGASIWDTFCRIPGKVANGDTLDVACDHYHRYADDFRLMRELGVRNYRLSVSWPRIIPDGDGQVNQRGIDFYHRLLDAMLEEEITPWVCFYHYDLPQALEDKGGWPLRLVPESFGTYCEAVIREYRDKVKHWVTINEYLCLEQGYSSGMHAPGRTESPQVAHQVLHHGLLAHGLAVCAVREFGGPGARVGMVHNPLIYAPAIETEPHIAAARTATSRHLGPSMEPLYKGAYPDWWLNERGANAPNVTSHDMAIIATPTDFFGLNFYTGRFVLAKDDGSPTDPGLPPGYPQTDANWLRPTPDVLYWGIRFIHELYHPGEIHISENGCPYPDSQVAGEPPDLHRIVFLRDHLLRLKRAVDEKYPVTAYFLWSFLDNFEWSEGYAQTFGIVSVNRQTLARTPKLSAQWYAEVMRGNRVV